MSLKILVAPDSFKDCITAIEFCDIAKKSILTIQPDADIDCIPMADGGEGTIDVFRSQSSYQYRTITVVGPTGEKIKAEYCFDIKTNTAILEMAQSSGLHLVPKKRRNPMLTTSYGYGELILDAINRGINNIILFIGGSATNDMGVGMLEAIGFIYYNNINNKISGTVSNLNKIVSIDNSHIKNRLEEVSFTVGCDVLNPLLGPDGATYTYGKQKGANKNQLDKLEQHIKHFSRVANQYNNIDFTSYNGAGAAGGVGFSAMSFLGAEFEPGFNIIERRIGLKNKIKANKYDLIITGEGCVDSQTKKGKLINHLGKIGHDLSTPIIVFCGSMKGRPKLKGIKSIEKISPNNIDLSTAILNAPLFLEQAIKKKIKKLSVNF